MEKQGGTVVARCNGRLDWQRFLFLGSAALRPRTDDERCEGIAAFPCMCACCISFPVFAFFFLWCVECVAAPVPSLARLGSARCGRAARAVIRFACGDETNGFICAVDVERSELCGGWSMRRRWDRSHRDAIPIRSTATAAIRSFRSADRCREASVPTDREQTDQRGATEKQRAATRRTLTIDQRRM